MVTLRRALGMGLGAVALMSLGAGAARRGTSLDEGARASRSPAAASSRASRPSNDAPCPPHTLPDESVCVRLPEHDEDSTSAAKNGVEAPSANRRGWSDDDEIPRRPDRPPDYTAYRYPVPCNGCVVVHGGEEPSGWGPPGDRPWTAGGPGIDLTVRSGTAVSAVSLENQIGPAELVYAGDLLGTSVVTVHSVNDAGGRHDYVVVLGDLDSTAPDLPGISEGGPAITIRDGQLIGQVGDRRSPRLAHLRLEVRRVRKGIDVRALQPSALLDPASTIACDPRNVLPLK